IEGFLVGGKALPGHRREPLAHHLGGLARLDDEPLVRQQVHSLNLPAIFSGDGRVTLTGTGGRWFVLARELDGTGSALALCRAVAPHSPGCADQRRVVGSVRRSAFSLPR